MAKKRISLDQVIDDIYINILRHLLDGRKKYSTIARDLGIAENTVRARVKKLTDAGVLRIVGLVDPKALPKHYTAYIGMRTIPSQASRIAEEVSKLKGVISASCVSGGFDVIVYMLFNDTFTMDNFVTKELAKVKGINSIEQFQMYKHFNSRCRYVL